MGVTEKKKRRKLGDGLTYYAAHGSGAGYDSSGEALFATVIAGNTLGYTSQPAEINEDVEIFEDEIQQEQAPVQTFVTKRKGALKLTLSLGGATNLAIACGYSAATSYTASTSPSGVAAKGVPLGAIKPIELSMVHKVRNSHDPSLYDLHYLPRVQVTPKTVLKFLKGEIREGEVTFNLLASQQDSFENPDGTHEAYQVYYETTATFDKCTRADSAFTAADPWDDGHGLNEPSVCGVAYDGGDEQVIPSSFRRKTPVWARSDFSAAETGDNLIIAAGVCSDDASGGVSAVKQIYTAATTWTLEDLGITINHAAVVICFDQYDREMLPDTVTITPGATGTGQVVITFTAAVKGSCVIIDEGPSGGVDTAQGSSTTWDITIPDGSWPVMVQCYNSSHERIMPSKIEKISATLARCTLSTAEAGYSIAIY